LKILALDTSGECCSAALLIDDRLAQRNLHAPRRHADLILGMLDDLLQSAGLRLTELDAIAYGCGPGSFTGVRIAAAVAQGIAFGAGLPVIPISTLAATALAASRQSGCRRIACALDARMGEVYWGCYRLQSGGDDVPAQTAAVAPDIQDQPVARSIAEPMTTSMQGQGQGPTLTDGAWFNPDLVLIGEEMVVAPEATPALTETGWCAAGTGWNAYPALMSRHRQALVSHSPRVPSAPDSQAADGRRSAPDARQAGDPFDGVQAAINTGGAEAAMIACLARAEFAQARRPDRALPVYLRNRVAQVSQR
jgi:tRNA threonylcarbamoyl adenosine modification protein YeaZ